MPLAHRKVHRYCGRRWGGHRLVASSLELSAEDERILAQRSDLAGDDLGGAVASYLTFYALPSGLLAFSRTTYDADADRTGAVRTETLLLEHAPLADTWPVRDPFVSRAVLQPLTPRESQAELEAARASDGPLALEPVIFDVEPEPPAKRLEALLELPEEILVALLSAAEGDLPFALTGVRDPERLVGALHLLLPLQGRPAHAFCTGALAPRDFARVVVAQPLAADRFVARAARDRDLALLDLAKPQVWNVNEGELAGRVARSLKAGGVEAILGLVERASAVPSYRAFADLGLQLRWEELTHAPSRSPEELVELANHLRHRGAPTAEVVACFRDAVEAAGKDRLEWAWNVLVLAWLPARLELPDDAPDPREGEIVRGLVASALALGRLQPVVELLEKGGERFAPGSRALVLAWARENGAALAGTLGPDLEPWLARELAQDARRGESAAASLAAFAALAGPSPDATVLAKAVQAVARIPSTERCEAARRLVSTLLTASSEPLWRELSVALDRVALKRVVRGVPVRLATAEQLAPLARALPLTWPDVLEELTLRLASAARPPRAPRPAEPEPPLDEDRTGAFAHAVPAAHDTLSADQTGAFARAAAPPAGPAPPAHAHHAAAKTGAIAVPAAAALAEPLDAEQTGALPRLAGSVAVPAAPVKPLVGGDRTPTDWSETPTARHAAIAPPAEPGSLALEALAVLARELLPRLAVPADLRAHRRSLAAIAHAGRRAGRPDVARAPRDRSVELALRQGGGPAVEGRAVARALAWGFEEPLALLETARRVDPRSFGTAAEGMLALELSLAAAAERVPPATAARLVAALSPGSFASAPLAGLVALQLLLGKLPDGSSLLDAAEACLAEAEAGLPQELERALVAPAPRDGLAATVVARALGARLERGTKPDAAPWLEGAVRVARVLVRTRAEEAERLALLGVKVLEGIDCPPGDVARVLEAAAELGPFARGKWHDVRFALARRAFAALDASREAALACLGRELPPLLEDDDAQGSAARLAGEKLGALVQAGKLDVAAAADLGARALGLALGKLAGAFPLKVQIGLESLAAKAAGEGAKGRPVLLVAIEHLRSVGDKELGARAARRIKDALGAQSVDAELRTALAALESGKPRRA